jgi:orotate phosphoribosyltransferase
MDKISPNMMDEARESVYDALVRVGASLEEHPENLRPLNILAKRLENVVRPLLQQKQDKDLMFLDSYLSLFIDDVFFNVLTDVSALVEPEERDNLAKGVGASFKKLVQSIKDNNVDNTYNTYKDLGNLWSDVSYLKSLPEDKLRPKYHIDPEKADLSMAAKMFNTYPATKQCDNILASGFPSSYHKDLDFVTLSAETAKKDNIAKYYIEKINEIVAEGLEINKLAFFEKAYGPIGALSLAYSIISETGIDGIYVRLRRRAYHLDQIKGKINDNDKIVIVSDVLTTGDGILKAADVIWEHNNTVDIPYAIVYYDRMQGGKWMLMDKGIKLKPIFTRAYFAKKGLIEEEEEKKPLVPISDGLPLTEEEEKELVEIFGEDAVETMKKTVVEI